MSEPDDDKEVIDLEDYPGLVAVARFARGIAQVAWFSTVGDPLDEIVRADAEAYLAALGFAEAFVADVAGWSEAEIAATSADWNAAWWESEEQLRAGLTADALALVGEADVNAALTHVGAEAAMAVPGAAADAAQRAGTEDDALINAAAGAGAQACHQAALVLAAAAEPDHPFALKFRLFEAGRWPIGVIGETFHLF